MFLWRNKKEHLLDTHFYLSKPMLTGYTFKADHSNQKGIASLLKCGYSYRNGNIILHLYTVLTLNLYFYIDLFSINCLMEQTQMRNIIFEI